jgi:hypothetical protein
VTDSSHGVGKRSGQFSSAATITLKQVKCDSLGGFTADPGHTPQSVDQAQEQRRIGHAKQSAG